MTNKIQQSGDVTPGHLVSWVADGVVKDNSVLATIFTGIPTQRSITTAPVQILSSDQVLNVNIAAAVSISLPVSTTRAGATITINDSGGNATSYNITISASGGETIDGNTSFVLTKAFQSVVLIPYNDGVNVGWYTSQATFLVNFIASTNNLILNSGMEVSQERGTTALTGVVSETWIVDGCLLAMNGPTFTIQQVADAPAGFKYSAKATVTTAVASPTSLQYAFFVCYVEGYRSARLGFGATGADSLSGGFWVKANRPGTYSCAVYNRYVPDLRAYVFNFTIDLAGTWEYKTFTIPGDTAGTWLTTSDAGFEFRICMMSGTNYTSAANIWTATDLVGATGTINGVAATSDYMQITGVAVIPGSTAPASSAAFVGLFDAELELAQRYYQKSFNYTTAPVQNAGLNSAEVTMPSPVASGTARLPWVAWRRKRVQPTLTIYNPLAANAQVHDSNTATDCTGTGSVATEDGHWVFATVPGGAGVGDRLSYHWVADARF